MTALIILNLSSKYIERVAYKVSDLCEALNICKDKTSTLTFSPEEHRMLEFQVLKSLDYRVSGEKIIFDQIVKSVKFLELHLPITHTETLSSIKSKATQISLNYLKHEYIDSMYSGDIIAASSTYLGIKYEEKRVGL